MGICNSSKVQDAPKTMRENLVKANKGGVLIRHKYDGLDSAGQLGEGVSGTVKILTRKSDGQKFAVKIMKIGGVASDLSDIRKEIALLASTDHPNVARVYETFEEKNRYFYIIMELCTGGELFDRLMDQESQKFTEADAAKVVSQMLLSLQYIHSKNMVHRDLKLENFIYQDSSKDSALKMIDFGFSRRVECMRETKMKAVVGTSYYIAPEVMEENYSSKCDLWSLGVIAFMLLSGSPPFGGDDDSEIMDNVANGSYSFNDDVWNNVSDDAKDFIKKLLERDVDKRLNAQEALNHAWMKKAYDDQPKVPLDIKLAENMIKYRKTCELKQLAMAAISFALSPTQIKDIQQQFLNMDTNRDGCVTLAELKEAITKTCDISEGEVDKMFEALDETHDGKIEISEFVAACLDQKTYMDENRLMDAFSKLDVDGSGAITKKDLKEVMGTQFNEEEASKIIADAGGEDGQIDYNEFLAMMRK
eukprot:g5867.t1